MKLVSAQTSNKDLYLHGRHFIFLIVLNRLLNNLYVQYFIKMYRE